VIIIKQEIKISSKFSKTVLWYFFFDKDFNSSGMTLLHTATQKGDVMLVNALLKMGEKTIDTTRYKTNIGEEGKTLFNGTPISIALCEKSPEVLAVLLKASDVTESIGIKCYDTKETYFSPFELAVAIAKATKNDNAMLVSINAQYYRDKHNKKKLKIGGLMPQYIEIIFYFSF
jgi:hypothetical protein